jgi:hypothetical protein
MILNRTQESLMNRSIVFTVLALALGFAAAPANAVVYWCPSGKPA